MEGRNIFGFKSEMISFLIKSVKADSLSEDLVCVCIGEINKEFKLFKRVFIGENKDQSKQNIMRYKVLSEFNGYN